MKIKNDRLEALRLIISSQQLGSQDELLSALLHCQPDFGGAPLFLPVDGDAGVEGDAVDPRPDVGAMLEALESFPKID